MKKHITWSLLMLEVAVVIFITSGCPARLWDITSPPYSISKPAYRTAGPDDLCTRGGIFFDFCNRSSKTVVSLETKMNVFDCETGAPAFSGTGCITTGSQCCIQKQTQRNFCISLDQYFADSIPSALSVDNFYISKIKYADGSEWKDYLGVYSDIFNLEA